MTREITQDAVRFFETLRRFENPFSDYYNQEARDRGLDIVGFRGVHRDGQSSDNAVDAFRHAAVSAEVSSVYGRRVAEALGNLNESVNSGDPASELMDQFNNYLGRELSDGAFTVFPLSQREGLLDLVENIVRSGVTINSIKDERIGLLESQLVPGESISDFFERTGGIVETGYGPTHITDPRGPGQLGWDALPARQFLAPHTSPVPHTRPDHLGVVAQWPDGTLAPELSFGDYRGVHDQGGESSRSSTNDSPPSSSGSSRGPNLPPSSSAPTPSPHPLSPSPSGNNSGTQSSAATPRSNSNGPSTERALPIDASAASGPQPILLDLDGTGLNVTELDASTTFLDIDGDGLLHRVAWAGAGDGVLYYDVDGNGMITEAREFIFTEWDPTATSDLEALRSVFDSNGDGKLTAADAAWSSFKVMVTQADGSQVAQTLDALGIVEIDLTGDATQIELPDGSVIQAMSTFTYAGGATGTVGDMILQADEQGFDVEQSKSTDAQGNRVLTTEAYGADGTLAFAITSVIAPDGSHTLNSYDDNGDGVVDRVQEITVTTLPGGEVVTAHANYRGADVVNGILQNGKTLTLSADGLTETIARDSLGAGWTDQTEVRVTDPVDGSLTITVTDLAQNGDALRIVQETVSADGLTRTESVDVDGDGSAEYTLTHTIVVHLDGSRTEITDRFNPDGTLRDTRVETVSADGLSRTLATDADSDGALENTQSSTLSVAPGGATTSQIDILNEDGSLRSSATYTQSADALSETIVEDLDGDAIADVTTTKTTTHGTGGSTFAETVQNGDGSLRAAEETWLSDNRIETTHHIDLDRDGVFDADELMREVTVDGVTGEVTAVSFERSVDGTVLSKEVRATASDGQSSTIQQDMDGDGTYETTITEATTLNGSGDAVTQTETRNEDNSLRSGKTETVDADGLSSLTVYDDDGDGTVDRQETWDVTQGTDLVETTSQLSGDGTLLSSQSVLKNADRTYTKRSEDNDGDGNVNIERIETKAVDGSLVSQEVVSHNDGSLRSFHQTTVSAGGLSSTEEIDSNGDGVNEKTIQKTRVYSNDGTRTDTTRTFSGDGALLATTILALSDDGFFETFEVDGDGDGVFERKTTVAKSIDADGTSRTLETVTSADGSVLGETETRVSGNGLETAVDEDRDGDGLVDLTTETTLTLNADGSTVEVMEFRDASGSLRERAETTISDDGRDVLSETDVDGDGSVDARLDETLADDGSFTSTSDQIAPDGSLLSRVETYVSGDGMHAETRYDRDGDGTFEQTDSEQSVYLADGSVVTTIETRGSDGSLATQKITTISDDTRSKTIETDLDGDGTFELTTIESLEVATSGVTTRDVETYAADGSMIAREERIESADRNSVTTSSDTDGNGLADSTSSMARLDDGTEVETRNSFSVGGALEGQIETQTSGNGLFVLTTQDHNGDGRGDWTSRDRTDLFGDGSSERVVSFVDGTVQSLGEEHYRVSADEMFRSHAVDIDGDGFFDQTHSITVSFGLNGSTETLGQTTDLYGALTYLSNEVVSGNRLQTVSTVDFDGTSGTDRWVQRIDGAEGGYTQTLNEYAANGTLTYGETITESADGRTVVRQVDLDGDGTIDQEFGASTNADQSVTTVYCDLTGTSPDAIVQATVAANGLSSELTFDVNGDGTAEFTQVASTHFLANGDIIETLSETGASGALIYEQVTTTSLNGLSAQTVYDLDGDGASDGSRSVTTQINDDGSRTDTHTSSYADGSLRAHEVRQTSSDGRQTKTVADYDGNGVADRVVETIARSNGETVTTVQSFNEAGYVNSTFVTTTSADGRTTVTDRGNALETKTFSATSTGSYSWELDRYWASSLEEVVYREVASHQIGPDGVDRWSLEIYTYDSTYQVLELAESYEVSLDEVATARLFQEAEKVFDTVLDRDLDSTEYETLIRYVSDAALDVSALASSLIGGGEFAARYGGLSDAGFVTQLYLNTYGRAPSMEELASNLSALAGETDPWSGVLQPMSRTDIASELALSAEHALVGNGHMSTNNFDTIRNPAQFERFLDQAYVEKIVESLYDVAFDRPPTAQELREHSTRLLEGSYQIEDIADDVLNDSGGAADLHETPLAGLSDHDFVVQAYQNALTRLPEPAELNFWSTSLTNGTISKAQFVAALAQSPEHLDQKGVFVTTTPVDTVLRAPGSTVGSSSIDIFVNTTADETFLGDGGSDEYTWAKGDGNDTVRDDATSLLETDHLTLADVASTDVALSRASGSDNLLITIQSTGETLTIHDQYDNYTKGRGLEAITFSDGVTWDLPDIHDATEVRGTSANNTLQGRSQFADALFGEDGDDVLDGLSGDDRLVGGAGVDQLKGGDGSDIYVWATGDGNDVIDDNVNDLTEIDSLEFTDVASGGIQLRRDSGSEDMLITVLATGEQLRVDEQFNSDSEGEGLEQIQFSDGVVWNLSDILAQTRVEGTASNNTVKGTSGFDDNLFGLGGNDELESYDGDDRLEGGTGNDILKGDVGSDRYIWAIGDGNDIVKDFGDSPLDTDTLEFTDVSSDGVTLTRHTSSKDLVITVTASGETITIDEQYDSGALMEGIEQIVFADGAVWSLEEILTRTRVEGTSGANSLNGTSGFDDNLYGLGGNDVLKGKAGNDLLDGGTGNDRLEGGSGSDGYLWALGDGNDTIDDDSSNVGDVDRVLFSGVTAADIELSQSGSNMLIEVGGPGGEQITVVSQFSTSGDGGVRSKGVEWLLFEDGIAVEILNSVVGQTSIVGTSAANTLSGWGFHDLIEGFEGNDYLYGEDGQDTLDGGEGNDRLYGGKGEDLYLWKIGDGNDTIYESNNNNPQVDVLDLVDVDVDAISLTRASGSKDLKISLLTTGETITVDDQFDGGDPRDGIEQINFAGGHTWLLSDIEAHTRIEGTSSSNTLEGANAFNDNLYGYGGDDVLKGEDGDDRLVGGTGNDLLKGSDGSDHYLWSAGDGNDTVGDYADGASDLDTLEFIDVASDAITLSRHTSSKDLEITVVATGDVITVDEQYDSGARMEGVEQIQFSDGVVWSLADILAHTRVEGTASGNTLNGTSGFNDNLYGLGGNDVLYGKEGDDLLVGGTGDDFLDGGIGSDRYEWHIGDGSDTIRDTWDSPYETDTLVLSDVADHDVTLTRSIGSKDLTITIDVSGETIVIDDQYDYDNGEAVEGIEEIIFANGVVWSYGEIFAQTRQEGTAGNDAFDGNSGHDDILHGLDGNDVLNGKDGDDVLDGGAGNDLLKGGNDSDTLFGSSGADTIEGGNQSDWLDGGSGADRLDGGDGVDVASYASATLGVVADLANALNNAGDASGDTFLFVENLSGSDHDDDLRGDNANNVLQGGLGNDTLSSADGDDVLEGGDGDDHLIGGAGADTFYGGDGVDLVDFKATSSAVTVDLATGTLNDGGAIGDVLIGIENLVGSALDDHLTGDAGANLLNGGAGQDVLSGQAGQDTLIGDTGEDRLTGGSGDDLLTGGGDSDAFIFADGHGDDTVTDFDALDATERLDFSAHSGLNTLADILGDSVNPGAATQVGTDVEIATGSGTVTLSNVQLTDLDAADFLF